MLHYVPGEDFERPLFVDVARLLERGIPEPPKPVLFTREDGHKLFYGSKTNVLFGDPECGKSWIAYSAVVEALGDDRKAAIIDADHNGAQEILPRLLALGATPKDLGNADRFRLAEPEDSEHLREIISDLTEWRPAAVVMDSIGELVPMLGYSSSSPDEYTMAHRLTMGKLALFGAAVIGIDHLPKSEDARGRGATGTLAKLRAISGASYRVTLAEPFAPGRGGAANLVVHKDRPGGVREHAFGDQATLAGRFVMEPLDGGGLNWRIVTPTMPTPALAPLYDDLAELDALDPPPRSKRDVKTRLSWGDQRASRALREWRVTRGPESGPRADFDND